MVGSASCCAANFTADWQRVKALCLPCDWHAWVFPTYISIGSLFNKSLQNQPEGFHVSSPAYSTLFH
ncbi:hypothetical protein CBS147343_1825 [Aspergillus niger]|nr:hypothetical protein CBS147320_2278 [Aspergillus niger]KAI2999147.1 hypothetical protein CBS147346_7826 [Aspergillus niger]KAI3088563.1 hypothetical protein CBS147343_1825 [Aspergillus niger]